MEEVLMVKAIHLAQVDPAVEVQEHLRQVELVVMVQIIPVVVAVVEI